VRKAVVRVVAALVLLAAAEAFNRAATIEGTLAAAQERLTTLRGGATAPAGFEEVEEELALAGRIPLVGQRILSDVRAERALASYWSGDYAALTGLETGDAAAPVDPDVLFVSANAAYRRLVESSPDRPALVRGLDDVVRRYSDVLKAVPGHVDAAYNLEYAARLRDAVSRGRQPSNLGETRPGMHGEEGQPPQGTKPPDFNVIVPMRPDERQDQFEAGVSGPPPRKG